MKSVLIGTLLFFAAVSAMAKPALIRSCDVEGIQAAATEAIKKTLSTIYKLNKETLNKDLVKTTLVGPGYLKVEFVSPRGNPMIFTSVVAYERGLVFKEGLLFGYLVRIERDTEGFIKKKTCIVEPDPMMDRIYNRPLVVNTVNNGVASISDFLTLQILGPDQSDRPQDIMRLELPMELVE